MATVKMTREQYKQLYGTEAPSGSTTVAPSSGGFTEKALAPDLVADTFKSGFQKTKEGYTQAKDSMGNKSFLGGLGNLAEGSAKMTSGAIETVFSGLAPAFRPIGKVIDKVGDKISDNASVQKLSTSKTGERITRATENISNLNNIFGAVAGPKNIKGKGVVEPKVRTVSGVPPKVPPSGGSSFARNVASEVVPTMDRVVNHQVTRALDLTAGDVKNISASTGNEVGRFMADNNLIRGNKIETVKAVDDFYKTNYDAVRSEIGKVNKSYKPSQIKGYYDALKQIKSQIKDVPGLVKESVEVENLMNKLDDISLLDVQKVKELMDEHFSLYKVTGDVKDSVAKSGLANIRKELKSFIENEVKNETGADIKAMNNNVSTARSIVDAVETRSTRGLTRSNLKIGDLGIFGVGMGLGGGNPLVGLAFVFGKKVMESPAFRLKFSKWFDALSDARKAKIQADLEKGILPPEIKVTQRSNSSSQSSNASNNRNGASNTLAKNDSKLSMGNNVSQDKGIVKGAMDKFKNTPNKQGGFMSVKIGGKSIKEIPEATKAEMVEVIDYMRLKKQTNKTMEDTISRLQQKYGINPDWSNERIANAFEKLVEITKTK